ncbi:MAG: GNAT family N-acyltransferase [Pseudomonadota bacterium]
MTATPMPLSSPALETRLATTAHDLRAAQHLRYKVFVEELGADGPDVDHTAQLECDTHDPDYDHLILVDPTRDPATLSHVVGVYRLMPGERAEAAGGFYCAAEYDLSPLLASGRRLLELGRSCLHPDVRGGPGLLQLWRGLADYADARGIEVMFGVASFHGTDPAPLAHPLAFLHHHHLAPPALRVTARPPDAVSMDLLPPDAIDRRAAARAIPALLKSYLRLGGKVGQGAWIDHAFNTIDVCLIVDLAEVSESARTLYAGDRAGA